MKLNKLPLMLLFLLALTACNKKIDTVPEVNYQGGPMVNFNNYMDENGKPGYLKSEIALKDTFITINVEIKLTNTTQSAANDIVIYLKKVDALVTDYNTTFGTDLTPLESASPAIRFDYSKPVIIKKGQRKVIVPIMVNSLKLNLSRANAIGIAIDRVEGASLNAGPESRLVIDLGATNQYHGLYKSNGYFYHPALPRTIDDRDKFGQTAGPNSIIIELGDLGGAGYMALFEINGTAVTITPAPGAAGSPYTMFTSGLPTTNPGYTLSWAGSAASNNTYNPSTKTFRVRYGYMGGSGWRVTEERIVKQ